VSLRQRETALLVAALTLVLLVDLLWGAIEGSTGALAYGFFDEPAHLATCVIALSALALATRTALPRRFVIAALIGSVAIDVDHIPGYLGSHVLTGSLPRPYSHSAALVLLLLALSLVPRQADGRQVWLGLAFGVSTHLFRDLATGPGISLLWPLHDGAIRLPYALYAGALASAVAAIVLMKALRLLPQSRRAGAGPAAALWLE
jgi:inner membrane protein